MPIQSLRPRRVLLDAIAAEPERYRTCRGELVVDVVDGIVYGQRLRPIGSRDSSGYLQLDLRWMGQPAAGAHRIVWESVHGPVPAGREINHIDGVKTNNRLDNLELVTRQENVLHAYRTGLKSNRGERHPSHKLTEDQVREMRQLRTGGATDLQLAARYGVSRRQVNDIVNRRSWSHIPEEVAS